MGRFSLGQLLVFVFAGCVYLAAARSLYVNLGSLYYLVRSSRVIDADTANEIAALWLPIVTQIGAWLVLSVLYCYWRMWVAMVVHSAFAIYLAYSQKTQPTMKTIAQLSLDQVTGEISAQGSRP